MYPKQRTSCCIADKDVYKRQLLTNVERTETGQRIYEDCHIDRLRAICCLKNAGMTIDDLQTFFEMCIRDR